MKDSFDKRVKKDLFTVGDLVLRWDARKDEKGKHGKFDNLWIGPFSIMKILGNNTFVLQNLRDEEIISVIADFTTLGESHIVWPSLVPLQTH